MCLLSPSTRARLFQDWKRGERARSTLKHSLPSLLCPLLLRGWRRWEEIVSLFIITGRGGGLQSCAGCRCWMLSVWWMSKCWLPWGKHESCSQTLVRFHWGQRWIVLCYMHGRPIPLLRLVVYFTGSFRGASLPGGQSSWVENWDIAQADFHLRCPLCLRDMRLPCPITPWECWWFWSWLVSLRPSKMQGMSTSLLS